jgi:hypothetical protein
MVEFKIDVRAAEKSDADSVFDLVKEFATSFSPDRESFVRSFLALLGDDSAWLNLAESNDKIVGYCLGFDHYALFAGGRVSWVEEIMVLEEWRRSANSVWPSL